MAVALKHGFLSLADFTPDAVQRQDIRDLLALTTMDATPPEAELNPSGVYTHELTVTLKSGEVLKTSRTAARGTLGDPFTDDDRWRKFEDCCTPVLGAERTAALFETLGGLAELDDVGALMNDAAATA
jgi:2-methylcitrate dehydratase PrpD